MKTKLMGLVVLMGLMMMADGQVLRISQKYPGDEFFAPYHIIGAEQLPFHTLEVQATQSPLETWETLPDAVPWQFLAGYGCWNEDQFDIATFANRDYVWLPPYAWFRSINRPCVFGFAPAELPPLNYFPTITKEMRAWRATDSRGRIWEIGPEVLPVQTPGVRRFLGVLCE